MLKMKSAPDTGRYEQKMHPAAYRMHFFICLTCADLLFLFATRFERATFRLGALLLSLEKRQAIKVSDKMSDNISARTKRTAENQKKILDYLKDNGRSNCAEIAGYIRLSAARTRAILSDMNAPSPFLK